MMDQELLQAELIRDEGLRLQPYKDTTDPPRITIGVGRNLTEVGWTVPELVAIQARLKTSYSPEMAGRGLTGFEIGTILGGKPLVKSEALMMLWNDIARISNQFNHAFVWWRRMTDARCRAFVNFGFCGIDTVLGFHSMLGALSRGDYPTAADELLNSRYAKQVGQRAQRLAKMIREG